MLAATHASLGLLAVSSGTHERAREQSLGWLESWLDVAAVATPNGAVIFDVDSTLVARDGAPIEAACRVHRRCTLLGIRCYIVTARLECPEGRADLERTLARCRVLPDAAFLCPPDDRTSARAVAGFKARCRRHVAEAFGRSIVASVGDQWHDLTAAPSGWLYDLDEARSYITFFPGQREVSVKLPVEREPPTTSS